MPSDATEIIYRRTQRQLGEVQVSLRLLADLIKSDPTIEGLEEAVAAVHKVKGFMFKRVTALEGRMAWRAGKEVG